MRSWHTRLVRVVMSLALVTALAGCEPGLGECDQLEAIRVAYDATSGAPAYEGQAIVIRSCGNGAFCHAANAPLEDRFGVPEGLTLDVTLASSDGTPNEDEVARLRRGRFRVVQTAGTVLWTIDLSTMPPVGGGAQAVIDSEPRYVRQEGAEFVDLPAVNSPEGREILRNWLACSAPVVERPAPRDDGVPAVIVPPLVLDPILPTWTSVYEDLLRARGCAVARCHGGTEAGFQVTDSAGTYAALVDANAAGVDSDQFDDPCETSLVLVAPNDPDNSLLFTKMEARNNADVCGDRMPRGGIGLNDEDLAAVRAWIENGAPMD